MKDNNNCLTNDSTRILNILNALFAFEGYSLASKLPRASHHFSEYLNDINIQESFFFDPIIPSETELEILSIPNGKSSGLYSYPTTILKSARNITSYALQKF